MKSNYLKIIIVASLFFLQSFAEAEGCYQAVRRCEGVWTAYNCITDYTSSNCSKYYCEDCGLEDDSEG